MDWWCRPYTKFTVSDRKGEVFKLDKIDYIGDKPAFYDVDGMGFWAEHCTILPYEQQPPLVGDTITVLDPFSSRFKKDGVVVKVEKNTIEVNFGDIRKWVYADSIKKIVKEEEKMVTCSFCGSNRKSSHNYVEIDGKVVCVDCFTKELRRCQFCGNIHLKADIKMVKISNYSQAPVCKSCADTLVTCEDCGSLYKAREGGMPGKCPSCERNYEKCSVCNKWHKRDKFRTVMDKNGNLTKICVSCIDQSQYDTCDHCSIVIHKECTTSRKIKKVEFFDSDMEKQSANLCGECASNYITCDDCGETFYRGDMVHNADSHYCANCAEDNGFHQCPDCGVWIPNAQEYCSDCTRSRARNSIREYSYRPTPVFFRKTSEAGEKLVSGLELEIDKGKRDRSAVAKEITDMSTGRVYCKHDGSLYSGFEIVSHPCTYPFHYEDMGWDKMLAHAVSAGFRSHDTDTCGLHVHIGRAGLGDSANERVESISKILVFFENNWRDIVKFSRRKESNLERWASRHYRDSTETPQKLFHKAECDGRYRAVNLQPSATVEIRVFRGTLRPTSFIASLQFCDSLCRLAKSLTVAEMEKANFDSILQVAEANDFSSLKEYLGERKMAGIISTITGDPDLTF